MGSSKQKTTSTTGPWAPTHQPLEDQGIPRIEAQYQTDMNDPNRVAPQARSYLGRVIGGEFLNPASNPHLGALRDSIWESVAPTVSSVFSRAGRGTSASDSGLAGALTRGFTSAMAAPMFQQYGQERGFQQQAASMAPGADAMASLPLEQYLERMRALATLGQRGSSTTTASPSALQVATGLTAAATGAYKAYNQPGGGGGG